MTTWQEHRDKVMELHSLGVWLVPGTMTEGSASKRSFMPALSDYHNERWDASGDFEPRWNKLAWKPDTADRLVIDVDRGDVDKLLATWSKDAYRVIPSSTTPGRAHVVICWLRSWGEIGHIKWSCVAKSDGSEIAGGEILHAKSLAFVHDIEALHSAIRTNPPRPWDRAKVNVDAWIRRARERGKQSGDTPGDMSTDGVWNKGDINDNLNRAVFAMPERAEEYRAKALRSGHDERATEATIRSALKAAGERHEALSEHIKHPDYAMDFASAASIARQHKAPIEYVHGSGWYLRGDDGWHSVMEGRAQDELETWTGETARAISEDATADMRNASRVIADATRRVKGRSELTVDDLDSDPDLIGLPDGTLLHLPSGETLPLLPECGVVRCIGVAPAPGEPSELLRFLEYAIPDADIRDYLRARWKLSLSGRKGSGFVDVLTDRPGSGKSVLLTMLLQIAGDLGETTLGENFVGKSQNTGWLLSMASARMGLVEEIPPGTWNNAAKALVTGDRVVGRKLYAEETSVQSKCHVTATANALPRFRPGDGWKRRVVPVRFSKPLIDMPGPKDGLEQRLAAQYPQIVHWILTADMAKASELPDSLKQERAILEIENEPLENALYDMVADTAPDAVLPVADVLNAVRFKLPGDLSERAVASALRNTGRAVEKRGRSLVVLGVRLRDDSAPLCGMPTIRNFLV